jgi:hypothetical protein
MNKAKLNFVIDAAMFLCMMAMAGLGFLMKYVMPPGRELVAKLGSNPYITWLGWNRHDWGDIHFDLAVIFLVLLAFHTILHWKQIVGLFHHFVPNPQMRFKVALIFVLLSILLIYFPFLITPNSQPRSRGSGQGIHRSQVMGSGAQMAVAAQPRTTVSP